MKKKALSKLYITLACCTVFILISIPFRLLIKTSSFTDIRPASALPAIFGMAFGFYGTLGCAIGKLITDIHFGNGFLALLIGFVIQIIYGYIPVIIWNRWRRNDENKFRLDRVYKLIQFLILGLFDSLLVTLLVYLFSLFKNRISLFSLAISTHFFNQLIFFIITGIPFFFGFSIWRQKKANKIDGKKKYILFSLNEKFILFILISAIIISAVASVLVYFMFKYKFTDDKIKVWNHTYSVCGITLIAYLCPNLLVLSSLEKKITEPLERMSYIGKKFGKEIDINLEIEKIFMRSNKYLPFSSEIGDLARSYNALGTELGIYVENLTKALSEKEKNATQLKIATEIQYDSLPKVFDIPGVELHASMDPAFEVGGDFYDFFMTDKNHLAIVVADVSGKGVPAALFMMISKTILHNNLKNGLSPAEALKKTNHELIENNSANMFVTVFCGIYDLETNLLTISNAGHNKPLLCKKNENFNFIKMKTGFVLGGMDGINYTDLEIQLSEGDVFFIYTDGISESMNSEKQEFGNERMINTLNQVKEEPLKNICDCLKNVLTLFTNPLPQFDDITMLGFRVLEKGLSEKDFHIHDNLHLEVRDFINSWCEKNSIDSKSKNRIAISLDELVSNIYFYSDADSIKLKCKKIGKTVSIKICDNGKPFNPFEQIDNPDITASLDERKTGGLGFFMVRKLMKSVSYERDLNSNILTIETECL